MLPRWARFVLIGDRGWRAGHPFLEALLTASLCAAAIALVMTPDGLENWSVGLVAVVWVIGLGVRLLVNLVFSKDARSQRPNAQDHLES